jgi:4-aminobutyrate aminotransferase-like enzyme
MTEAVAAVLEQRKGPDGERSNLVATGGTIVGNALALAAARAVLTEISRTWTRTSPPGTRCSTR